MRKNLIFSLFFIVSALCCTMAYGQKPPAFALHISSPIGFIYKIGITVEYRPHYEKGILLNYTHYGDFYPGYQGSLQYRLYSNKNNSVHENILYFKAGTGFADFNQPPFFSPGADEDTDAPGTYYFGGAGVGRHFNFGNFFLELCMGLKYTYVTKPPPNYNERLFYSIGPGSIPDVHFTFGLQL